MIAEEDIILGIFLTLLVLSAAALLYFGRKGRKTRSPAGWPRLIAGNLLVFLCLISLLLTAGEVYYRFCFDTTDVMDQSNVSDRWFQRHYHKNSWGCRDDIEYSLQIPPGRRRITFLGDSFTAGHGVNDVNDVFGCRIRHSHPQWEVQMVAQPGFNTGDEYRLLETMLKQNYQLNEVVLVYCLNDIEDLTPECGAAIGAFCGEAEHMGWFTLHSYFLNTVDIRFRLAFSSNMKKYHDAFLQGYGGAPWQQERERLKALRDLVQAHGGRLSVVVFPFFQSLGPRYEYQFVHDELTDCCRELQVPCLDLLPVYKDLPPKKLVVNHFDPHPNVMAHALAADAISKFLDAKLAAER